MQLEAMANFDEAMEGLAGATIEVLKADLHADFVTRAHPEPLLRLLKEMCEGHHEQMQDLFHDQPNTIFDIDITNEVTQLFIELEIENSAAGNIDEGRDCQPQLILWH